MFKRWLVSSLFVLGQATLAFAEGPAVPAGTADAAAQPAPPSLAMSLAPFALMFAVLYFLMIRPQQKKQQEQQDMMKALQHGDEVLTTSGLLGTIRGITEKVVTLEIAENVRIKMMKSQIAQVIKPGQIKEMA